MWGGISPFDTQLSDSNMLSIDAYGLSLAVFQLFGWPQKALLAFAYSDRRLCCDDCPRLLSSEMRSNDDNDWPVHFFMLPSMIYAVFLWEDYFSTVL